MKELREAVGELITALMYPYLNRKCRYKASERLAKCKFLVV